MSNRCPQRWPLVKEAFAKAMEQPKSQRGSFLLQSYSGDPELVCEVHRLAALADEAGGFLSEPAARPAAIPEPGQEIAGRYRILERIGMGGMSGGVFLAMDEELGVEVAVKPIANPSEFLAARQVNHPNVYRVYDCVPDGHGAFALIMEFLRGETLEERLASQGSFGRAAFLEFAAQLSAGVEAIHQAGIVHADLKPANILLTGDGRAVIVDFGLSGAQPPSTATEVPRQVAGTLPYMAPELLAGRPPSRLSDIYSLGMLLHEAATGALPFDGASVHWSARKILSRCLEMNPLKRPPSAAAVARALQRAHGILRFWFPKTLPGYWTHAKPEAPPLGSGSTPIFTNSSGLRL